MFESDNDLPVITKSLITAGAIFAITGVTLTIHRRRDGVAFKFAKSAEAALRSFLKAKRELDRLVAAGA